MEERLFPCSWLRVRIASSRSYETRVREGSRLALEMARASVERAAKARGWAHETNEDMWSAIYRLDGIDEQGI